MLRLTASVLMVLLMIGHAVAGAGKSGDFEYYVMSLSWTPSYCDIEGRARGSAECRKGRGFGFALHGLWPQYARGWPSYCSTGKHSPSRSLTASMADVMGSGGLAYHEWDKHGRCSGLSAKAYFALARKAYGSITRPTLFRRLLKPVRLSPRAVKAAFLKENQSLKPNMVSVACKQDHFQEVRICLNKDLTVRRCGADVLHDCRQNVVFPPIQ